MLFMNRCLHFSHSQPSPPPSLVLRTSNACLRGRGAYPPKCKQPLGAVAGRLLFGNVSAPALQARFALGGEQFVFVQDAQGDVVDGVEVGGVAVRLKSRFGGGNRGKIAADLVQHQRLSAHDDDDQQQADGAAVAVCRLVQQGGEDDKSADERGAGFERRGFGRIRRLLCHCRAPCCG